MGDTFDLVARLTLVPPSLDHLPSYLEFIEEMRAAGDTIWPTRVPGAAQSPEAFVAGLLVASALEPPAVPETARWGVVAGHVVGFIALRHHLNEKLAQFGGHVGYEVRPSSRRRGVATGMLRLVLATDRARSMGRSTRRADERHAVARGGTVPGRRRLRRRRRGVPP